MAKKKKTATKSAAENKRFQPHFRKAYNGKFTGHPQYVYDEQGREYKVLGITSSPKTNGVLNVRLEHNPEPNNPKTAYVRPKPDSENKGAFGDRLKGWKFSESDKKKVRTIIDTHNKKK
ncbi:MAG: hypothetical protein DBX59_07900 [Bacillota bacterium]|nr:MAG: hypothetical protein DBX59_07900 [Bacillota bacterium]